MTCGDNGKHYTDVSEDGKTKYVVCHDEYCNDQHECDVCSGIYGHRADTSTSCVALGGTCCSEPFLSRCPANPANCAGEINCEVRNAMGGRTIHCKP